MSKHSADIDTAASYTRGRSNGAHELARLLGEALTHLRNDPLLRPQPLSQPALDAIAAYEVISAALNPAKSPGLSGHKPRGM